MFKKTSLTKISKTLLLAITTSSIFSVTTQAQCLTNSLNISTGYYNGSTLSVTSPRNTDPNWYITNGTLDYAGMGVPFNAVVEDNPVYSTFTNSEWITPRLYDAFPGIISTQSSQVTFTREFRLCKGGEFDIDMSMYVDDYVVAIAVDGTPLTISNPQNVAINNFGISWTPSIPNVVLTAGTHTLEITVESNHPMQQQPENAIGLDLTGTITEVSSPSINAIVNDQDAACASYECPEDDTTCDDLCYWRVIGNNINGGNNIFGTLNGYSVNIQTEAHDRGILTPGGSNATDATAGRFGWNTMNPTARLHVDCINGNEDGSGTSDIRFENLESGEGYVLVIDDAGYVYNTYIPVSDLSGIMQELRTEKKKNNDLQNRIDELTVRVGMLEQNTTGVDKVSNLNNKLYQNTPNPFDKSTTIEYSIKSMNNSAYIIVYDLNGRELNKTAVEGDGSITIDDNTLTPGMYLYSLVIDGVAVDTKRMILSK